MRVACETGRDATVFWNYIDLRFRSPNPFRIEAFLDAEKLTVRFRGKKITEKQLYQISRNNSLVAEIGSCATCGVDDCHRVVKEPSTADFGKTAWLLDERTPEFDEYVKTSRHAADALLIPLDGKRFKKLIMRGRPRIFVYQAEPCGDGDKVISFAETFGPRCRGREICWKCTADWRKAMRKTEL